MIIQCEQCTTRFKLDDTKVTERGVKVRCSRCRHVFIVTPSSPEEPDFDSILQGLESPEPGGEETAPPGGTTDSWPEENDGLAEWYTHEAPGAGNPAEVNELGTGGQNDGAIGREPEEMSAGVTVDEDFSFTGDADDAALPTELFPEGSGVGEAGGDSGFLVTKSKDDSYAGTDEFNLFADGEMTDYLAAPPGHPGSAAPLLESPAMLPAAKPEDTDFPFMFDDGEAGSPAAEFSPVVQPDLEEKGYLPFDLALVEEDTSGLLAEMSVEKAERTAEEATDQPLKASSADLYVADAETFSSEMPAFTALLGESKSQQETESAAGISALAADFGGLPPEETKVTRRRDGSSLSRMIVAGAVLLAFFLAGVGFYLLSEGPGVILAVGADVLSRLTGEKGETEGGILLRNVRASFLENRGAGELLVITGEAINNFRKPRASVKVKGVLFGSAGNVLIQKSVYCGNSLSSEQLAQRTMNEIDKVMGNEFGDSLANLGVQPGAGIPFMIVFAGVPGEAREFAVEVENPLVSKQ